MTRPRSSRRNSSAEGNKPSDLCLFWRQRRGGHARFVCWSRAGKRPAAPLAFQSSGNLLAAENATTPKSVNARAGRNTCKVRKSACGCSARHHVDPPAFVFRVVIITARGLDIVNGERPLPPIRLVVSSRPAKQISPTSPRRAWRRPLRRAVVSDLDQINAKRTRLRVRLNDVGRIHTMRPAHSRGRNDHAFNNGQAAATENFLAALLVHRQVQEASTPSACKAAPSIQDPLNANHLRPSDHAGSSEHIRLGL